MLLLLAIPVVVAVTFAYRLVQTVAPSNILIARVRSARPTIRRVGWLGVLVLALVALAHTFTVAIEEGAPGWLNVIVFVLLWDAIKISLLALLTAARRAHIAVQHRTAPSRQAAVA